MSGARTRTRPASARATGAQLRAFEEMLCSATTAGAPAGASASSCTVSDPPPTSTSSIDMLGRYAGGGGGDMAAVPTSGRQGCGADLAACVGDQGELVRGRQPCLASPARTCRQLPRQGVGQRLLEW